MSENQKVSFTNNDRTNEFVITINRDIGTKLAMKVTNLDKISEL